MVAMILLAAAAQAAVGTQPKAPATPIANGYPAAAAGDGAVTAGGFAVSRWAEDWHFLNDPSRRKDWLDRLKYLPLTEDGESYLTLSGGLRARVNLTTNPNLREGPHQRQDISRVVGGADLHIGRHVRLYGEVAHGGIGGRELGASPATLRNDFVIQQSFADVTGDIGSVALGVRYGRQEFTDGPNLLISQRDNNTIRYTLNGWRGWARGQRVRIDLFDLKPTAYGDLGTDDDTTDPARRFSGVTAGIVLPETWLGGSKLYLDPYYWRRRNSEGTWAGKVGPAVRRYAGVHLWGDAGRWTIDWTANRQYGRWIGRPIDAWQVFLAQTWRTAEAKQAPRIGVHFDYASGGGAYGTGALRNAYAPFGNNIYYSYQLFLTPSNLAVVAPNVTVTPFGDARLTAEVQRAWRPAVNDAVYRANGQPFAGTQLVPGRRIADVWRLQLVWPIARRLSFTGRYEHLDAGPALTRANYRSSDFFAGWLSFRL